MKLQWRIIPTRRGAQVTPQSGQNWATRAREEVLREKTLWLRYKSKEYKNIIELKDNGIKTGQHLKSKMIKTTIE